MSLVDPSRQGPMRSPAPRIPVKDQQMAQTIVQQYGPSLLPGTVFVLPDGKAFTYNPPDGQQPGQSPQSPGMTTQPQAAPDRNTNNPINLGQQYYENLTRLYEAQAKFQEEALKQFVEEAATGNPALKSMLGNLQYSMNEDQLPPQERQALNAQRETNLQQSLDAYGPGQKEYLLSGNPQGMGQRMRDLDAQKRGAYQNAMFGEGDERGKAGAYWKGQGMFERPTSPMAPAQGRVTDLNNIGPNGQRTNPYKQ